MGLSRKSNYKKNMESPYWGLVKHKVRLRDNFECVICKNKKEVHVHHITYQVYGFSIVSCELQYLGWLILLCKICHYKVHKNKKHPLNPKNPFRINVIQFKQKQNES